MKKTALLLTCILGLAWPATAFAGKAAKGAKRTKAVTAQPVLAKFDKNRDGRIDGKEAEALGKAFDALIALDKNKNGKLDDDEISAIQVEKQAKRKKQTTN